MNDNTKFVLFFANGGGYWDQNTEIKKYINSTKPNAFIANALFVLSDRPEDISHLESRLSALFYAAKLNNTVVHDVAIISNGGGNRVSLCLPIRLREKYYLDVSEVYLIDPFELGYQYYQISDEECHDIAGYGTKYYFFEQNDLHNNFETANKLAERGIPVELYVNTNGRISSTSLFSQKGIPAVIFDYTEGFRLDQLDSAFTSALKGKLDQKIIYYTGVSINPFIRHEIEISGMKMNEKPADVAQRIRKFYLLESRFC